MRILFFVPAAILLLGLVGLFIKNLLIEDRDDEPDPDLEAFERSLRDKYHKEI